MRWILQDVAAATGGRIHGAAGTEISGITQDSRGLQPGMLFVPLAGTRDGHDFIGDAIAAGASACLTSRPVDQSAAFTEHPQRVAAVEVPDTLQALGDLARAARRRLGAPAVVGITGSVGKTTTKDMLASILRRDRSVWASAQSFNNEIGVPLTLLSAAEGVEALVIEMGTRGLGHIAQLCSIARPTIGVVTHVGLAHTSELGSLEGVAAAKRELVESLPQADGGGVAVLNSDVPRVRAMAAHTPARVVFYGRGGEVTAEQVRLDDNLTASFVLRSRVGSVEVRLGAKSLASVDNALAAAAVAIELGVSLSDIALGLREPAVSPHRMQLLAAPSGARVLDDCYNANPISMTVALRSLAALPARRRIAVLGVMAELGACEQAEHARVAALAAHLGIKVIAVDAPQYAVDAHVTNVAGVAAALATLTPLGAGDAVLVKGSRVVGLEQLVELLTGSE